MSVSRGHKTAAIMAYSALTLSSAFAPLAPASVTRCIPAMSGYSPFWCRLRGGGSSGSGGSISQHLDSWLRRQKLGDYSPYAASSLQGAAGDRDMSSGVSSDCDSMSNHRVNRLQKLMVACEVVFDPVDGLDGQVVPSEADLEATRSLLNDLSAEDLGVPRRDLADIKRIVYTDIVESDKYTMCIFTLPTGAKLPLHDHPHMTVLSKVLWGEMKVTAFDRAPVGPGESAYRGDSGQGLLSWLGGTAKTPDARVLESFPVIRRKDGEVWTAAAGVQLTRPSDCNIHEFTAASTCCVVDILAPPYDWQNGRRCTYYEVQQSEDGTEWARAVRCPSSFVTVNRPYSGLSAALPQPSDLVP
jgi:hypothetical protein